MRRKSVNAVALFKQNYKYSQYWIQGAVTCCSQTYLSGHTCLLAEKQGGNLKIHKSWYATYSLFGVKNSLYIAIVLSAMLQV